MQKKCEDKKFLKPIPSNIPPELKEFNQWVCWKAEERNGKETKIPFSPKTGKKAKSNDPATWTDFQTAIDSYRNGNGFDGVGFCLTKDDNFVGWDIDNCVDEAGNLGFRVAQLVKAIDSYHEYSPSGKGIRVFVKAKLPPHGRKKGNIEVYESGRYLTVTGWELNDMPLTIEERQKETDELHHRIFGTDEKTDQKSSPTDHQDILQKAFNSKNGREIRKLYDGNISGFASHSEADLSFCCHLAYWFNGNENSIDQAFRSSGLYRKKWDKVHFADGRTYGQATIEKAVNSISAKHHSEKPQEKIEVLSLTDFLNTDYGHIEPVIGEGILPEGGGLILAGESEAGKSLLTLEWSILLALGWHLLEGKLVVPQPRKTIIIQTENMPSMVQERVRKMIKGLEIKDIPNSIFFADPLMQYDVGKSQNVKNLISAIDYCKAEVFIIDPLASFHSVNENDNSLMRSVMDKFTYISRVTGAASIIVHHFGKPVEGRDNAYRLRGASSLKDWADTLVSLEHRRHEHKILRLLNFEKVRHGKKPKPVLLERDEEYLTHHLTEADMIATPKEIQDLLLSRFGGRVETQKPFLDAIVEEFHCSPRTASNIIKEAVGMKMIGRKKVGREVRYYVPKD